MAVVLLRLVILLSVLWAGIVRGLPDPIKYVNRVSTSFSNASGLRSSQSQLDDILTGLRQPTPNSIEPRSQHEGMISNETVAGNHLYTRFMSETPAQLNTSTDVYHEAISQGAVSRMRKKMVKDNPIFVSNRGTSRYPNDWTTVITVINATPYRWRRGYIHSYQIDDWDADWPKYIEPGESFQTTSFRLHNGYYKEDSAAEVVYQLEGTWRPVSFMLQRRRGRRHHVWVKFLENLETDNLKKGAEIDLGFHPYPAGSQFLLAGWEGEFITVEPPKGWMRDSLNDIGNYSLSEIVLPRSHHVAMSTDNVKFGFAVPKNTLTQTKKAAEQIERYGVRVLDLRVILSNRKFYAAHGTMVMGSYNGMLGEKVEDVAKAIGKFHKKYPGELIIIDIPSAESARIDLGWMKFHGLHLDELYSFFIDYARPMKLPKNQDITRIPLNQLIGKKSKNRKGGTIIRVDRDWALIPGFPGPEKGFVSSDQFPLNHRWSDKDRADKVAADQIKALQRSRPRRNSQLFFSDWIATQTTSGALLPEISITKLALPMYNVLYSDLWNATTDLIYPNWIAMDHIHAPELVSFVRTLNRCLVARRCGTLGGKVPIPANPIPKGRNAKYDRIMKDREEEEKKKAQEEAERKALERLAAELKEERRQEEMKKQKEQEKKEEKQRKEQEKRKEKEKKKKEQELERKAKKKNKKGEKVEERRKEEKRKKEEEERKEKEEQKRKEKEEKEERREWEKKEKEERGKEKKHEKEKQRKEKEEAEIKKKQQSEKQKVEMKEEEEIQERKKERLAFKKVEQLEKVKEMELEKERQETERLERIKNFDEEEKRKLEEAIKKEEEEEFERIKTEMESR